MRIPSTSLLVAASLALWPVAVSGDWYEGQSTMDNVVVKRAGDDSANRKYPLPRYITQHRNHFDDKDDNMWKQAYFVNDTFWKGAASGAPVFLCVGGEGPALDGSAVVDSVHCSLATEWLRETGALMFALEHRYYGCHNMSACPVDTFEPDVKAALRFLSSRQAVEDVATFITTMNKAYSLTAANKWITWGGSYPGMLAGWSRLKHPELVHASVASSAPVHAKLDMYEYNDAVSNAYTVSDNGVGGSADCRTAITQGHAAIKNMLGSPGGIDKVEELLGLPPGSLKSKEGQIDYLGSGVAYFPAQGNDPTCTEPVCNIKSICAIMTNTSLGDQVQRLQHVRQGQLKQQASRGLKAHQLQRRPRKSAHAGVGLPDFWFYQTCTEFGFYQTCSDNSSCMFVRGLVDVESEAGACKEFGISLDQIAKNIEATNAHYGALAPSGPSGKLGSCVLWPNGEVDPWSTLSVLKSPSEEQPTLWIPGASHHAWTHPSSPKDQPSVVAGRKSIREQVTKFLSQECKEEALMAAIYV